MPSKSGRSGQGPDLKKFRSSVARLKKVGLVSARVDARSQRPTRYMKEQVKRFNDVLEGRARVVKVPHSVSKEYADAYRKKRDRIVVPAEKGDKVFYDPKAQRVVSTRKGYEPGLRLRREFIKTGEVRQPLPPGYVYVIPLGSGEQRFDTWEDAVKFMSPYEVSRPTGGRYAGALGDWREYLIVERNDDFDGDE